MNPLSNPAKIKPTMPSEFPNLLPVCPPEFKTRLSRSFNESPASAALIPSTVPLAPPAIAQPTQSSMAQPKPSKYDNPKHPLYLHHSDQPGLVLVSNLLDEENYGSWSQSMTMALNIKNKFGFVDGSIKQPNDDVP